MSWHKGLLDNASWGIVVYQQKDGNIEYANLYAKQLLDFNNKKRNIKDFISSNCRPGVTSLNESLLYNESFHHEICVGKASGQNFYAELSISKIKDQEGLFALMFKDITYQLKLRREILTKQEEITRTYDEILKQNEDLKALDKAKDRFIALISHELRTPLSAMIATSEVLKLKLVDSEEQRDEFVATIFEQGQYLLEIVNDILDFAKIQAGKAEVYIEKENVIPLVKKTTTQFEHYANEKNVNIELNCKEQEYKAYFDSTRLKQIVSNILNNAIKFTKENTKVCIEISEDDSHVIVAVSDQGDGIPENLRNKVFDEFVTLKNINSHKKGTGLGMPISKKLIELMGGHIGIDNAYNDGAKFILQIPKNKILNDEFYRSKPDDDYDLLNSA